MKVLKELRGTRSQEYIATKIGITQRAYSNYETGKREPDFNTLEKLADFFSVSVDYLLGRDGEQKKTPAEADVQNKLIDALSSQGLSIEDLEKLSEGDLSAIAFLVKQLNNKSKD